MIGKVVLEAESSAVRNSLKLSLVQKTELVRKLVHLPILMPRLHAHLDRVPVYMCVLVQNRPDPLLATVEVQTSRSVHVSTQTWHPRPLRVSPFINLILMTRMRPLCAVARMEQAGEVRSACGLVVNKCLSISKDVRLTQRLLDSQGFVVCDAVSSAAAAASSAAVCVSMRRAPAYRLFSYLL